MQGIKEFGIIDVGMDAVIRSQQTNDSIECIVLNITKDYTDVMAVTADPRVCKLDAVELGILAPTGESVTRCTGRAIWHLKVDELGEKHDKYLVRIFVTDISQMDQKALDLLTHQKETFTGSEHAQAS
ncbi:hypothetical protein ACFL6S_28510 [Candidatus Poribacteria bacterium]